MGALWLVALIPIGLVIDLIRGSLEPSDAAWLVLAVGVATVLWRWLANKVGLSAPGRGRR